MAEADPTGGARVKDEASRNMDKALDEMEHGNGELVMNKIIEALVLLEERTRTIGERLEHIESRMSELSSTRNENSPEGLAKYRPRRGPRVINAKWGEPSWHLVY
jgi:hypothetical protein